MNRRSISALLAFTLLAVLAGLVPARAAQHFVKVREVLAGTSGNPNVQFIEVQNPAASEYPRNNSYVRVYGATGSVVGTFTRVGDTVAVDQATTLFATAEAQSYFGITADVVITAVLPAGGGAVCFMTYDCVSWGNFTGTASLPSPAGAAFNPTGGLLPGQSAERRITGGSNSTKLDTGDDTDNSAADFQHATPSPRNNAGQTGAPSGTPSFTADQYTVHETAGSVTITAQRGDTSQPITVTYETLDGTATAGQDYTSTSGSLSYAVSEASKSFAVPILEDGGPADADEQFTVRLKEGTTTVDTATVIICGDLPGVPRSLTATASGQNTINLAWQAPVCAGDSAVTNYVIYEGTSPNPTTIIATVPASPTTYSRTGLPASSTRYYKVAALNAAGTGAQSNQAQATTASNDTGPPTVTFSTPNNSVIVLGMPPITGSATDDVAVSSFAASALGLANKSLPVQCTGCGSTSASFVVTISGQGLNPGPYTIRVTALDPSNKPGQSQIAVIFIS